MPDDADGFEPLDPRSAALLERVQDIATTYLTRFHGHEIEGAEHAPAEQALFVGNHGFGGLFDLNVLALMAARKRLGGTRPSTVLVHQVAWSLGLGRLVEPLGMRRASRAAAAEGFARGHHVLVLPGGDLDAFKSHRDRNQIVFAGRSGFARLAMEADVPIIPIVTAGAGDSLYVLSDGQGLAKALGLDRLLRVRAVPISLSVPWGLNVGLVGFLPYLPLPCKLRTRVLEPMRPESGETAEAFARRVERAMQDALDDLLR